MLKFTFTLKSFLEWFNANYVSNVFHTRKLDATYTSRECSGINDKRTSLAHFLVGGFWGFSVFS
jgi:hypothetical protein